MRQRLVFLGCAVLILAAAPPSSWAQTPEPPGSPADAATPVALVDPATGQPASPEDGPRFDFAFDALPLSEVIQLVRKQFHAKSGQHLNVIVPDHLRALTEKNQVTMDIKQVTVSDLFKILGLASKQDVRSRAGTMPMLGGGVAPRYETTKTGYTFEPIPLAGNHRAYLLTANLPPPPPEVEDPKPTGSGPTRVGVEPPPTPRSVQFFQLRPYLEANYRIEDIITAMKTGWDLSEADSQPTVKFHEETQLLVVAGQRGHLDIVEQVLQRLAGASRTASISSFPGGPPPHRISVPPAPTPAPGPPPRPVPVPSVPNPAPTP